YELDPDGPGNGGSGGGGPGAACNGFSSTDASCQSCFTDSVCCSQASQCDADCKSYIDCQSQCTSGDVAACQAACKTAFSFGAGAVERLLGCLATECAQCGGLQSDSGPIGTPAGGPAAGAAGAGGGGPGLACQAANACTNAACQDCDRDGTGSCETFVTNNQANCGACGRNCLSTACSKGQCLAVSAANGLNASTRLAAGGGYLYWVSKKDQIDTLPGDAIYRVNVTGGGQPEPTYVPAGELTIFDFAVDVTGFYLVTDQGVMMREHASTQQPAPLAAGQNALLAGPTAEPRARVGASSGRVFFSTPLETGEGVQVWAAPKAAGATAAPLRTFSSKRVSMLAADEGGVFVASDDGSNDPGLWYVTNDGAGVTNLYDKEAGEFAFNGLDVVVVSDVTFEEKLVAAARGGSPPPAPIDLLADTVVSEFRAVAADESGLYYLAPQRSGSASALMRVRREPGATTVGAPVELLAQVPMSDLDLPLALDASWIYGVGSSGTSIWRVPK
ncbi:MAG TPA: hypothetical protein VFS00_04515, partial [Polyangiaceae bacterium]|nr:hypothetical protein [Polyangiaceae bacterium]